MARCYSEENYTLGTFEVNVLTGPPGVPGVLKAPLCFPPRLLKMLVVEKITKAFYHHYSEKFLRVRIGGTNRW